MLKARGLKVSRDEIDQPTRMMNDDLECEPQEAEKTVGASETGQAVDRFMAEFCRPAEMERRKR